LIRNKFLELRINLCNRDPSIDRLDFRNEALLLPIKFDLDQSVWLELCPDLGGRQDLSLQPCFHAQGVERFLEDHGFESGRRDRPVSSHRR
jgi:hypothetical protein